MKATKLMIIGAAALMATASYADNPKREFRGAWMHTIFQGQYKDQSTEQNKAYLKKELDSLKAAGVNAVLFQVRPQADALYPSSLEPWSRFLTNDGNAPEPFWDPLEFMVEECHKRGLELHAWLNPYRVTSNTKQVLPKGHIYHKHPERFIKYDGKLYFDPGMPENREFIGTVVDDIVARYDIDGIHFDDYFYPYPVAGKEFGDDASYKKYGNGMKLDDWRRKNVDLLIEDLHKRIHAAKPWVRFGVSPFGIHRNKSTDPNGSETSGLQNYDALFADVLLWEKEGWIDYLIPQLYWELEHKAASYLVLVDWWNKHAGDNCHLYIGQDVSKAMTKTDLAPSTEKTQLRHKVELARAGKNIKGNCWWPGYAVTKNVGGAADSLKTYFQSTMALVPSYANIKSDGPQPVKEVNVKDGVISWKGSNSGNKTEDAVKYVVYRFSGLDNIDMNNAGAILDVTPSTNFKTNGSGVYVITALDRVNNESEGSSAIIIE